MATPGVSSDTTPITSSVWRIAKVRQIRVEAPGLRTFTFGFEEPVRHLAGQHYEIRLTSEDGYQAARLYSAASPADGSSSNLELTIALMPYGEISPYLFRNVTTGTQLEIRGPLGKYFVWSPEQTEPVLLVGGGTGVVPLRAMLRAHAAAGVSTPMRLLYSVRTLHDMAYRVELAPNGIPIQDVRLTFTEQAPEGWPGYARRIDAEMVREILAGFNAPPMVYVCGPTPMVEAVSNMLVAEGLDPETIKTERFGPTG